MKKVRILDEKPPRLCLRLRYLLAKKLDLIRERKPLKRTWWQWGQSAAYKEYAADRNRMIQMMAFFLASKQKEAIQRISTNVEFDIAAYLSIASDHFLFRKAGQIKMRQDTHPDTVGHRRLEILRAQLGEDKLLAQQFGLLTCMDKWKYVFDNAILTDDDRSKIAGSFRS